MTLPDLPPDVRAHCDWLLSLAPVPDAGLWVDLGCGDGTDVLTLAARYPHDELQLVGLDGNASSIERANTQGAHDKRVVFRHHRLGTRLPFHTATVDVAYSHNLIECVGDREAFAGEVARILKPGGWAVMAHWDWDSQCFNGTNKAQIRRLLHAYSDWQQDWMEHADGWMGRRLWGTFNSAGLHDGTVNARVLTNTTFAPPWYGHAQTMGFRSLVERGLLTKEDYESFLAEQQELHAQGRYFYSLTGYAYVGRAK